MNHADRAAEVASIAAGLWPHWQMPGTVSDTIYALAEARGMRRDAVEAFLPGALRQVVASHFQPTSALVALDVIPLERERIDPGATSIRVPFFQGVGRTAPISAAIGKMEVPVAETESGHFDVPGYSFGNQWGYTVEELLRFAFAASRGGSVTDVAQGREQSARIAIDARHDEIAANGESSSGVLGFFNQSIVDIEEIATPWTSASAAAIIAEATTLISLLRRTKMGNLYPRERLTWVLPGDVVDRISTLQISSGSETTVATFLSTNLNVQFVAWERSVGAGAGATNRGVIFLPLPEIVSLAISVNFDAMAPQIDGFSTRIYCWGRTHGVFVRRPDAMLYTDGH